MGFNLFKKIGQSANKTFSKGNMKKAGGALTKGLHQVGNVLGKIGSVGGQILNNPLTQLVASTVLGPEAGMAMNLAGRGLNIAKKGSAIAHQAANISNVGSYKGSPLENSQDAKQRLQDLANSVRAPVAQFV